MAAAWHRHLVYVHVCGRGETDAKPRQPKTKLLVLDAAAHVFVHRQVNSRAGTSRSISCRSGPLIMTQVPRGAR